MIRRKVRVRKANNKKFCYINFGSEPHGRFSFRLWVHPSLVKKDKKGLFLRFPIRASLYEGKQEWTRILKPSKNIVYDIFVKCPYLGMSYILPEDKSKIRNAALYKHHSGPETNGISEGFLVEMRGVIPLTYRWTRVDEICGRLETGLNIIFPDGKIKVLESALSVPLDHEINNFLR